MSNGISPHTPGATVHGIGPRERLVIAVLAFAVVITLGARTTRLSSEHPEFENPWDHHKYIWMAENNPAGFHIAPFCWRVVTPGLARVLPLSTERSFYLITVVALALTALMLYLLSRALGFDRELALTGMLLFFALGWATGANLNNFWKPDPLAALFVTSLVFCIVTGKLAWYVVLLALGAGVKESVLFAAPLFYTLNAKRLWDGPLFMRSALLSAPAVLILVALRFFIPAWNGDPAYVTGLPDTLAQVQLGTSEYGYGSAFRLIGLERLRTIDLSAVVRWTLGTFGVILLALPFASPRRAGALLLRFSPFILLVYAQPLFATNVERLLVLAVPALIPAALFGADALGHRLRVEKSHFVLLPAVPVVVLVAKKGMIVIPWTYEAMWLATFLILVTALRELQRE